ncbi:MAG: alpha/beta hydrolase-fold protein [Clostridia bacterium]|nr:alpha/beta hydrolase-fold protein [Clostridia bacterium]
MKKLLSLLLALLMLGCAGALADMNAEEYVSVVAKELPDAEDMVIDVDNYYGQVIEGYYNFDCYVNENVTRTAKFYIPANTVYNQPTVFIMVPSGVNTWGFFVESGWKAAADKYVFHVVLAETDESGVWGDIDTEMEYLAALRDDVSYRPFFVSFSSNFYAIAYGNAADVLMKHTMSKPLQWAAAACIGVTGVEDEYLASRSTIESKEAGVMLSEMSIPMFIVSEEKTEAVDKVVDYWKKANKVEDVKYSCDYADEVYIPAFPTTGETMDREPIAKVYYSTRPIEDYYQAETIDNIYNDFMCKYMLYPGTGNGSLRSAADIYEMGFEKFAAQIPGGYKEDGSDLYNREWYVYVPSSVDPETPAPVVFLFHGAGGTGDEIAGRSGWTKIAEEKGCILVCPTGSHKLSIRNVSDMTTNELFRAMWNTGEATEDCPDDRIFIRELHKWVCENYNVDTGRVYATGQSSGGAMSHAVAGYMSDIFTASAPVSALATPSDYNEENAIPLMVCIGTGDPYFSKEGFGGQESGFSDGKGCVTYWTNRYNTVDKWEDFTYMKGDESVCSFRNGIFRNYVFRTEKGIPMLRCVETETKVHAYLPSEAAMIWDEWFSLFHKDADGNLYYMNQKVEL